MTNNPAVIKEIEGRAISVRGNDIDTDRIIPARFLRCVTFEDLGEQVFQDERYRDDGTMKEHPFNDPRFSNASILVVNANFGCGSSREHAPQALMRFGIKAIIGASFAEIFAGNCTALGIPVFSANEGIIQDLQQQIEAKPESVIRLNLESKTVVIDGKTIPLEMNSSVRTALLEGTWNTLEELLQNESEIEETYARLAYISGF
jgi:3-isopropylmalate/(R)-2-methylmalate dehydratase small subunit